MRNSHVTNYCNLTCIMSTLNVTMTSPSPAAGVPTAVVRGVGHPEGDQGVPEVDPAGEAQLHDGAGQDQPGGRGGRRTPAAPRQRDPHRLSTGQNTHTLETHTHPPPTTC
jgi:hypothetical protein